MHTSLEMIRHGRYHYRPRHDTTPRTGVRVWPHRENTPRPLLCPAALPHDLGHPALRTPGPPLGSVGAGEPVNQLQQHNSPAVLRRSWATSSLAPGGCFRSSAAGGA